MKSRLKLFCGFVVLATLVIGGQNADAQFFCATLVNESCADRYGTATSFAGCAKTPCAVPASDLCVEGEVTTKHTSIRTLLDYNTTKYDTYRQYPSGNDSEIIGMSGPHCMNTETCDYGCDLDMETNTYFCRAIYSQPFNLGAYIAFGPCAD